MQNPQQNARWADTLDDTDNESFSQAGSNVANEGTPVIWRTWELPPIQEVPPLQLPPSIAGEDDSPTERPRQQAFRTSRALSRPGPSSWLYWCTGYTWLMRLHDHGAPLWLVHVMIVHLHASLFGTVSWQQLESLRGFLRQWWPVNWRLPSWMTRLLRSRPI